ncbi:proline-rich receptor-like protein kinase PERK8 isoform X2 [Hyalella azteca]|uniref:Proline-rich receptor-like protein kinase PERK8 isoform X2 n=1 Tax=Hyalella azteca TaxID=294128 RepID=A0A8B7PCR3_HYAAZ|nr:proline-rich receptor-like protein kinase PERK8 isoform X2 [Hyalella azteca]
MAAFIPTRPGALPIAPIAPHLQGSQVLRMVQEEGGIRPPASAPQWPPPLTTKFGAHDFMAKCARAGGREVEWPPRGADPSIYLSNPSLKANPQAHSSAPNLAITSESELPKPPTRLPSGIDPSTGVPPVPPPPTMASQSSSMTTSSSQPLQPGEEPNQTTVYPSNFKLRNEMPIHQEGARVVTSQPAFKMTKPMKMRGDSKWPPASAAQDEPEQQVREFIKPKKQCKDYSSFFAQHQLPPSYTGYRAPPGTQHVGADEEAVDM